MFPEDRGLREFYVEICVPVYLVGHTFVPFLLLLSGKRRGAGILQLPLYQKTTQINATHPIFLRGAHYFCISTLIDRLIHVIAIQKMNESCLRQRV